MMVIFPPGFIVRLIQRQRRIIPILAVGEGNVMLNKSSLCAVMLAAVAVSSAAVAGDRDFNTAAGAVIGASIGHSSGGRDGAIVGGVLGAVIGNSLSERSHDGGGYYQTRNYQPAAVYYEPAPVYYAQPQRYPAPPVVYVEPGRPYYRENRGHYHEVRRDYHDYHDYHEYHEYHEGWRERDGGRDHQR